MTRLETQVLIWLAEEQRPVSHLAAMPTEALTQWVRAHGGRLAHDDAAFRMRAAIQLHFGVRAQDAGVLTDNVMRLSDRGR